MSTYSLRIPDDLMNEAKQLAESNSTSLNQFFLSAIAERVGAERTRQHFAALAARADAAAFRNIMARVPNRRPLRGDEIPS
jgi:predicted transcriptional regulator